MVRGHVGEHGRLVGLVAHAAQDEAAARGLEDRHVDVGPPQDRGRAARARSSRRPPPGARRRGSRPRSSSRRGGPASSRMCVMSRVTVDLPLVPGDRHDRHAPVLVADPGRRRRGGRGRSAPSSARPAVACVSGQVDAAAGRDGPLGQVEGGLGDRPGALGARPRPGDDPAPGSDARWTWHGPSCSPWSARSRRVQATRSATASGHSRAGTVRPRWTSAPSPGVREPVPRPRPPDGDLDLDHRLQPVDVGSLEQPDLDRVARSGEDNASASPRSGRVLRRDAGGLAQPR